MYRKYLIRNVAIIGSVFLSSLDLFGVGVDDLDPNTVNVALCFNEAADGRYNNFMSYGTVESERLYVSMRAGESFNFGFQFMGGTLGAFNVLPNNSWVRIKDTANNVVFGPVEIVPGQPGYINDRAEAVAGPSSTTPNGYDALKFIANSDGDYYIEVAYSNDGSSHQLGALQPGWSHFMANLYDFNVMDASGNIIDGRVWSKAWHIVVMDGWNGELTCQQYIYTDDGIVSKLDYNGIVPYEYVLISNDHGTTMTGDPFVDRQSIADATGALLMPQYKLFFDEPDTSYFPIANLDDLFGQLNGPITVTGCDGDYCINVDVDREANALLLLDFNGIEGYQDGSSDRLLETTLATGPNCISWDGEDGNGSTVTTANIEIEVSFLAGVTHMPMYDVEYNENGLLVEFVYPESISGTTEIYWDDSQVAGTVNDLVGCQVACHSWDRGTGFPGSNAFGNEIILNSWWYIQKEPELQQIAFNVPPLDAGPDVAFCAGSVAQLQATTGFGNYQWSPAASFNNASISNPEVTGMTSFMAFVTVQDVGGCNHIDSLFVDAYPLPVAAVNDISYCQNEQGQLVATGGDVYRWLGSTVGLDNPAINNPNVTVQTSTSYEVEVENLQGCKDTATANVTVHLKPNAQINPVDSICDYGEVQLQASGGGNYLWISNASTLSDPAVSNPTASPGVTSSFQVEVTSAQGCKDTADITVDVRESPVAVIDPVDAICQGEEATVQASGGSQFEWINNLVGLVDVNLQAVVVAPFMTSDYTVVVSNSLNCLDTASITLVVHQRPVAVINPPDPICEGESAPLQASGGEDYRWISGGDLSAYTEALVTSTATSTTTYQVEVASIEGCLDTAGTTLVVHQRPSVTVPDSAEICSDQSTDLVAAGATDYAWSPAAGLSAATGNVVVSQPTSSTLYSVIGTNDFGCKDTATVWVSVVNGFIPDVSITANDACAGGEVMAAVTVARHLGNAPIYSWYLVTGNDTIKVGTQSQFSSSSILDGDQLFLTVQSNAECIVAGNEVVVSNSFPPNIWAYPDLSISENLELCEVESGELTVVDEVGVAEVLTWYRAGVDTVVATGSFIEALDVGAGDYYVKSQHMGCEDVSATSSIGINYPELQASVNYRTIMAGESVNLSADHNGDSLTWLSDLDSQYLGFADQLSDRPSGDVIYTVQSQLGNCVLTDTLFVHVVHPIEAPYFFSPNNDGSNDGWLVNHIDEFAHHHITIYNRWGSIIRDYVDSFTVWDGLTSRGAAVPDGVYFYVIQTEVREDVPVELTGYVTVTH